MSSSSVFAACEGHRHAPFAARHSAAISRTMTASCCIVLCCIKLSTFTVFGPTLNVSTTHAPHAVFYVVGFLCFFAVQDPKEARSLLRSGAFSGLRDSVRAVGQFVSERGQGQTVGAALVSGFTKELEGLDVALMLAVREGRAVDEDGNARLKATTEALDRRVEFSFVVHFI
jgi:hypothetical protein